MVGRCCDTSPNPSSVPPRVWPAISPSPETYPQPRRSFRDSHLQGLGLCGAGVPSLWDLTLDDLRWSWCNNNRNKVHNNHNVPQFSSVQSPSRVWLFAASWTAAHQASLSITNSWSSLKLMSIESVMPSNHLILLPSIFPSIRVFSN